MTDGLIRRLSKAIRGFVDSNRANQLKQKNVSWN